jgi:hypothetical protein
MKLDINGYSFVVTTGGYESATPSDAILRLEEAEYQTYSSTGSFESDKLDLPGLFSTDICRDQPIFTVQYGRSSDANDHPTYQVLGHGMEALEYVSENVREIASSVEDKFRERNEYATHRPLIRAHAPLTDGSVIYTEAYYHSLNAESIKRFELRTLHPNLPFGVGRYNDIFEVSPVRKPQYIEEIEVTTHTVPDIPERATEVVRPTVTLVDSTVKTVAIENPITPNDLPETIWKSFKSPSHLFAESYLQDGKAHSARISDFRAVEVDDVEPVFYQAEIE